jgi:hypothetical protein
MANRTFSRLQASPPNVLGNFQGTPGTIKPNICLGLRLARLITLKWLGQRPLSEKMYDLPSNGINSDKQRDNQAAFDPSIHFYQQRRQQQCIEQS